MLKVVLAGSRDEGSAQSLYSPVTHIDCFAFLESTRAGVTWQEAATQVHPFHTIAALVYHMNYYVSATLGVLQGRPLEAKDKHSFDLPPIQSEEAWHELLKKSWDDAENLACLMEELPESQLSENFVREEYGSYYRCLLGPIEHCHYHLGQIALIKKMLEAKDGTSPCENNGPHAAGR